MRRSFAVLLSAVLTAMTLAGPHSTAAVAAAESGKVVHTWYTGTMAPGATKTSHPWLNILPDKAYDVSLSPVGASSSASCQLRVLRVWNEQRPEGNKDFWYTIKNVGSLACAANVMVYRIPARKVRSTGGIAPREIKKFKETSLDDDWSVYRVGLLPSGATSSDPCKLEVTRFWYTNRVGDTGGPVFDLTYEVKNVGDIACQGDVLLGSAPVEHSFPVDARPWWPITANWSGASPAAAYLRGLRPSVGCTLELESSDDVQKINTNGTVEREVSISAVNAGGEWCESHFTLVSIEPDARLTVTR
jgi:hypothetical protein